MTTKVCLGKKELRRTRRAVFEPISRMFCRDKEPLSPARYFCSRCHVRVCAALRWARGGFGIQIWSITSPLAALAVSEHLTLDASRALHRREKKQVELNSFQTGIMSSLPDLVGPFLSCWYFLMHSSLIKSIRPPGMPASSQVMGVLLEASPSGASALANTPTNNLANSSHCMSTVAGSWRTWRVGPSRYYIFTSKMIPIFQP